MEDGVAQASGSNTQSLMTPGIELEEFLHIFWERQMRIAEEEEVDWKGGSLPLARIKKVMKSDVEVKVRAHLMTCHECY